MEIRPKEVKEKVGAGSTVVVLLMSIGVGLTGLILSVGRSPLFIAVSAVLTFAGLHLLSTDYQRFTIMVLAPLSLGIAGLVYATGQDDAAFIAVSAASVLTSLLSLHWFIWIKERYPHYQRC